MRQDDTELLTAEGIRKREEFEAELAENAWARQFLDDVAKSCGTEDCPSLVAYVGQLKGLVTDMKRHVCRMHIDDPCDLCSAYDSGLHVCSYELRMHELGIKVE